MSGIGKKHPIWTKELDNKLIREIVGGKKCTEVAIDMNMSYVTILKRIREMGFDGIADLRNVMTNC
jgi:hypothetical protein